MGVSYSRSSSRFDDIEMEEMINEALDNHQLDDHGLFDYNAFVRLVKHGSHVDEKPQ